MARCTNLVMLLALALLGACDEGNPSMPTRQETDVNGTWDASFSGTVQGAGTAQRDSFVMQLQQDGARVVGTISVPGLDVTLPLSGTVTGTRFRYTSQASLGPGCEASLAADTTVDTAAGRLSGSQTQTTCEGTAVGQVTAIRR